MPRVIGYWQLPDDERTLLAEISTLGPIVAFTTDWRRSREEVRPEPLLPLIEERNPTHLRLALASQVALASIEQQLVKGEPRWGVALVASCVIDYRRGRLENGRLALSNLAAYTERLSEDGSSVIKKDATFVDWSGKVFAKIRRATPEWHKYKMYRATRAAKAAHDAGTLELCEY